MSMHQFLAALAAAGLYTPADHDPPATNGHPPGPPPAPGDPRATRYSHAALHTEAHRVATTPEGARNHELNRAAYRMGQLVGSGYLAPLTVIDELARAAADAGLGASEARATILSGLRAGQSAPRAVALRADLPGGYVLDTPAVLAVPETVPAQVNGHIDEPAAGGPRTGPDREDRADQTEHLPVPFDWPEVFADSATEPDWLIPDVIERGRSYVVYARHKTGKSLLLQYHAAQLAAANRTVLYIDYENSRGDIVERLRDEMACTAESLAPLKYFSFPAMGPLDTIAGAATLFALIDHYQPDLVILDTTSRIVAGEENSSDTYRALYRALAPLKARDIAVVRIDHAGKDGAAGQRGSSAKGDDVDCIWLLVRHDDEKFQLKCDAQRSNHHPQFVDLVLREAPLRFERVVDPFSRPEVEVLADALDRLGVPPDAGRVVVRDALTRAGIKASSGTVREAVRVRKVRLTSWDERSRTAFGKLILPKINNGGPEDQLQFSETAGQRGPGPVEDREDRGGESQGRSRGPGGPPPKGGPPGRPPGPDPAGTPAATPAEGAVSTPADPAVCDRCHRPAGSLVVGTRGQRWCVPCAYPDPTTRPGATLDD